MKIHPFISSSSFLIMLLMWSGIAAQNSPVKHFRSNKQFIKKAISLNREKLINVKKSLELGNINLAWEELLKHFKNRKILLDPVVLRWIKKEDDLKNNKSWLKKLLRYEEIVQYNKDGKVDWTHNNKPARKDYEKYWSRNRHNLLAKIIRTSNALDDSKLRKMSAGLFLDWFKQCPPPRLPVKKWFDWKTDGFAWREIEAGIRGRHLVSFFLATRSWKDVPIEFHQSLLISIQQNMDYLLSHYAKAGPLKGNHQTHHAAALVVAGILLPEFKSSSSWKKIGLRILKEHIHLDYHSDGVQKEHSPSYHMISTQLYLDPYEVFSINKITPPEWMKEELLKMLDFLLHSTAPDGRLVTLNDCFPTKTKEMRSRAAEVFKRPDMLALEGFNASPLKRSHDFKKAGIAFMRSSWKKEAVYVVLDASGYGSSHWHAGKPNLVIHAGGEALACDPQLASYDDPSFWKYFHTAKGHNTILVDGQGDGTPSDFWRYSYISKPKLVYFKHTDKIDIAIATTDGFKRLKSPVTFKRRVLYVKPNLIFVEDVLNSKGEHTYEWLLHLVPQKPIVEKKAKSMMTNLGGDFELICTPLPDTFNIVKGPSIRQGKHKNYAYGRGGKRGKYWSKPKEGEKPALMVNAPYGVWTQKKSGKTVFRFVLQVLSKDKKKLGIDKLLKIEKDALAKIKE
ncbi:MAG: hypothetical protein COA79_01280 [Planctomycetota bacterium]|nr:MAG: hypothetical protein COA79_01280 [Planctomycetota bacterium]